MELLLHRAFRMPTYTIGRYYIDGKPWKDCCEDRDRGLNMWMPLSEIQKVKVYGETAIPTGRYRITLTYSDTFKRILPLINAVPGWTGVRIHAGNSSKDSKGCQLPGTATDLGNKDWVSSSRAAENELIAIMQERIKNGEEIWLTII